MGRPKTIIAALLVLLLGTACQPADDSDLLSPENELMPLSPAP